MPTYIYSCDECGKQFEQFQSFKDEPLQSCPCEQRSGVRRVFQPVGIVFKGSGWYINDSRKSGSEAQDASTSKTSEGDKSDSSSSDTSKSSTSSSTTTDSEQ